MRQNPTKRIERYRLMIGPMGTCPADGANGAFLIPFGMTELRVIASDGSEWDECGLPPPAWEHVSVSVEGRCPTWDEMAYVKSLFWRDDELVIQMHVPVQQHVNYHEFCLHLWKPIGVTLPIPPMICVGPQ